MKDYKRLTDKYYPCVVCKNGKCLEQQYDCEEREVCEAWNRLFQLENKIERGELISTVQSERGDQEVAFFVAHNAAVRKQAVKEFADKIIDSGTTVYDPLCCRKFIKLPMERYEKILKEECGE